MRDVVCWREEHLKHTLSTDADEMGSAVFMAVHTPMRLQSQALRGGTESTDVEFATTGQIDERQVHSDLTDPNRDFVLMPVLGSVGSGKSHLVRWLAEHIEDGPKRRVIRVPRTANVRRVLLDMLDGLDGEPFTRFRQQIERSAGQLPAASAREKLLNDIALFGGPRSPEQLEPATPEEKVASRHAHVLLYEPMMRERLLREGGVVDRVASDTLHSKDATRGEETKTEFGVEDLQLDFDEVALRELGEAQRTALRIFGLSKNRQALVTWLNRALTPAARQLLSFRDSSEVMELFTAVRREFGRRGIELVILIEDLVRMSTIADPLLDLAMQRPNPDEDPPLCPIRTVFACTRGKFNLYIDTLRSRVEPYVVWTEGVGSERDSYTRQMCARYLNAARVGPDALAEWHASRSEERPPNACDACTHRATCHEVFEVEATTGAGYYPFTPVALGVISRKVMGADGFDPRALIKSGIDAFLRRAADELRASRFPSDGVWRSFGLTGLGPVQERNLRQAHGVEAAGRMNSLSTIWGDGRLASVSARVADAFGVPVDEETTPPRPEPEPEPDRKREETRPEPEEQIWPPQGSGTDRIVREVREWRSHQRGLGQNSANKIRDLLHREIARRIPWELRLLNPGFGGTSPDSILPGAAIVFRDQTTRSRARDVELRVPIGESDDERLEAALVFEHLLRADVTGGWGFSGGLDAYAVVCAAVERWADHATELVARSFGATAEGDDPLFEVAWLLWVANHLVGRPVATTASAAARIEYVLAPPPPEPASALAGQRAGSWRRLLERFEDQDEGWAGWDSLLQTLQNHLGARKGRGGVLSIDAARLGPLLARVAAGDGFSDDARTLPVTGGFRKVSSLLRPLKEGLAGALEDEAQRVLSCRERATDFLGAQPDFVEVQKASAATVTAIREAAVSKKVDEMRVAASDLGKAANLDATWKTMGQLAEAKSPAASLSVLSSVDPSTMHIVDRFVTLFEEEMTHAADAMSGQTEAMRSESDIPQAEAEVRQAVEAVLAVLRNAAPAGTES